jgi:hypothetical protein
MTKPATTPWEVARIRVPISNGHDQSITRKLPQSPRFLPAPPEAWQAYLGHPRGGAGNLVRRRSNDRATAMPLIDAHITSLDRSLRGPGRAKGDLLTEARDGLVDAAESFQRQGLGREDAERRAIAEFGPMPEVAAAYQVELGIGQARRTALAVLVVMASQPVVWNYAWRSLPHGRVHAVGELFAFASQVVEWLGGLAIAGALLIMGACGIGLRLADLGRRIPMLGAIFGLAVSSVFATFGVVLTLLSPAAEARSMGSLSGLPWTMVFLMIPLAGVAVLARRCLELARACRFSPSR